MLPISDEPQARTFPYVNVGIIIANILVFLYEITLSDAELTRFFFDHGVVPQRLVDWLDHPSGLGEPFTIYTAAFLHGGWLHLFGNMLYLWVFGDNVEDAIGHAKYFVFYLVAAVGAVALQVALDPHSTVPMVGASGAIAGVLGAYLIFYPRATVGALVVFIFLPVPAVLLIGFWFALQLVSGLLALSADSSAQQGVAVWAHVGGFLTGAGIALAARPWVRRRPLLRRGRATMW